VENWWNNENGRLSLQILQEFYVSVTRKIAHPMDSQDARQIVADLAQWKIHTPVIDDLLQAIDIQQTHQLSFWDAMVIQSAVRLGCRALASEAWPRWPDSSWQGSPSTTSATRRWPWWYGPSWRPSPSPAVQNPQAREATVPWLLRRRGPSEYDEGDQFVKGFSGTHQGRIGTFLAPGQVDTREPDLLAQTKQAANEMGIGIQIHAGKCPGEFREIRRRSAKTTVGYLGVEWRFYDSEPNGGNAVAGAIFWRAWWRRTVHARSVRTRERTESTDTRRRYTAAGFLRDSQLLLFRGRSRIDRTLWGLSSFRSTRTASE